MGIWFLEKDFEWTYPPFLRSTIPTVQLTFHTLSPFWKYSKFDFRFLKFDLALVDLF